MKDLKNKIRYYSEVKSKTVEWLWYPFIPFGKVTMILGDPGCGKSSVTLFLTSILSNGKKLPLQEENVKSCNIIYQNREDNEEDTVKPRLDGYGANCDKVIYVKEDDDIISIMGKDLEELIKISNAKVLILDPLQAFFDGGNMLRVESVRPIMNNLIKIAENTGTAIILIGHLNKNEGGKDLYRAVGSIDFTASPRCVNIISEEESLGKDYRVLTNIKNNLAKKGQALSFRLKENTIDEWAVYEKDNICSLAEKRLDELVDEKGINSVEAFEYMEQLGFSKRTVERAKKNLEIASVKEGGHWIWRK